MNLDDEDLGACDCGEDDCEECGGKSIKDDSDEDDDTDDYSDGRE